MYSQKDVTGRSAQGANAPTHPTLLKLDTAQVAVAPEALGKKPITSLVSLQHKPSVVGRSGVRTRDNTRGLFDCAVSIRQVSGSPAELLGPTDESID